MFLDFRGGFLCRFQAFDELGVGEDGGGVGIGELEEERVLQLCQDDFEFVLSSYEVSLGALELRLFGVDNEGEDLLLETFLRDCEVYQSTLRSDLGFVVGVRQLRLENQAKARHQLDILACYLDHRRTALQRTKGTQTTAERQRERERDRDRTVDGEEVWGMRMRVDGIRAKGCEDLRGTGQTAGRRVWDSRQAEVDGSVSCGRDRKRERE